MIQVEYFFLLRHFFSAKDFDVDTVPSSLEEAIYSKLQKLCGVEILKKSPEQFARWGQGYWAIGISMSFVVIFGAGLQDMHGEIDGGAREEENRGKIRRVKIEAARRPVSA